VWCLRFPEPEEEIRVNRDYLADTDYEVYVLKLRKKVSPCVVCNQFLIFLSSLSVANSAGCRSSSQILSHLQTMVGTPS